MRISMGLRSKLLDNRFLVLTKPEKVVIKDEMTQ